MQVAEGGLLLFPIQRKRVHRVVLLLRQAEQVGAREHADRIGPGVFSLFHIHHRIAHFDDAARRVDVHLPHTFVEHERRGASLSRDVGGDDAVGRIAERPGLRDHLFHDARVVPRRGADFEPHLPQGRHGLRHAGQRRAVFLHHLGKGGFEFLVEPLDVRLVPRTAVLLRPLLFAGRAGEQLPDVRLLLHTHRGVDLRAGQVDARRGKHTVEHRARGAGAVVHGGAGPVKHHQFDLLLIHFKTPHCVSLLLFAVYCCLQSHYTPQMRATTSERP